MRARSVLILFFLMLGLHFSVFAQFDFQARMQQINQQSVTDMMHRSLMRHSLTYDGGADYPTLELGYGYALRDFFVDGSYETITKKGYKITDVKYSKRVALNSKYNFFVAMTYPLTDFGEKSSLGLRTALQYNSLEGKPDLKISQNTTNKDITYQQLSLPLTLEYKIGADARLDKQYRGMFSFGVGMMPSYGILKAKEENEVLSVSPMAIAEAGIFFGIAFKVRATFTYYNKLISFRGQENNGLPNTVQDLKLNYNGAITSGPELNLSVCIMPTSFLWDKYK